MSEVLRRDYRLSGVLGAGGKWRTSTTKPVVPWEVRPATAIVESAFAVHRTGRPVSLGVIALESALVVAAVTHTAGDSMRWSSVYDGIHPHVKHFLMESIGLAVTIDHCRDYGWTPFHELHHVDALSAGGGAGWAWLRPSTGPRPDIAYAVPATSRAGVTSAKLRTAEAKARGEKAPVRGASKDQKHLMKKLNHWSWSAAKRAARTPYVRRKRSFGKGVGVAFSACWVWMGEDPVGVGVPHDQAQVDTFDPGVGVPLSDEGLAALEARTNFIVDAAIQPAGDDSAEALRPLTSVAPSARAVFERVPRPGVESTWVGVIGASQDLADLGDSDEVIANARQIFDGFSNGARITLIDASFGRRLVGLVLETDSEHLDFGAVEAALAALYQAGPRASD